MHFGFEGARDFQHCVQRNGIQALLDPEQQSLDDRESQRQLQAEGRALAQLGFQTHRSFQAVQHALHDIHADPASGNFGDLLGRAEAGTEDIIQGFGFRELGEFFRRRQPEFDGLGANLLDIDAASVVADFHDYLIPMVVGIQPNCSLRALAELAAFFRRLNAVADGVADQMGQRLGNGVQDSLIQIGIMSADRQLYFAVALARYIAHHARETPEELIHGYHANLHYRALQIVEHARLKSHGIGEFAAQQLFGIALGKLVQRLLEHGLANDQLAHKIEDAVDAGSLDSEDVF